MKFAQILAVLSFLALPSLTAQASVTCAKNFNKCLKGSTNTGLCITKKSLCKVKKRLEDGGPAKKKAKVVYSIPSGERTSKTVCKTRRVACKAGPLSDNVCNAKYLACNARAVD